MDPIEKILAGLAGVALVIVTAIFGRQTWKRRESSGALADAQDSVSRDYVGSIEQREREAVSKLELARSELSGARDEITGMKIRSAARDVKVQVLMQHVLTLTRIVVENNPAHATWARESAFVEMFDDSDQSLKLQPPPRRK